MTKGLNAQSVLNNLNERIAAIEEPVFLTRSTYHTREVCEELSIFDWWKERLSRSQLLQMRSFLNAAIRMGYTGYVCFKVGAKGCASGMWAYKAESEDGFSPEGACIYRSFQSSGNYWDACGENGVWLMGGRNDFDSVRSARQLEKMLA